MTTVQFIDSTDSLIPNGNFVQGLAYWEQYVNSTKAWMYHVKFFGPDATPPTPTEHEGNTNLKDGEPKYGLWARVQDSFAQPEDIQQPVYCRLNRNDLFRYPIRRYVANVYGHPVTPRSIDIPAPSAGAFIQENTDWGTVYDAVLTSYDSELRIVISDVTSIVRGAKFQWMRPNGTAMEIQIDNELPRTPGEDFRSFTVSRTDSNPITPSDTGENTTVPPDPPHFGISVVYPVVVRVPERGAACVFTSYSGQDTRYYLVDRYKDGVLRLVAERDTLRLIASTGDVEGIVYCRNNDLSTATLRVFGSLQSKGVTAGDYFVVTGPFDAYGKIEAIQVVSGVEELIINTADSSKALPVTGPSVFKPITAWAVSPLVTGAVELPIPGVRYDLTLAFTTKTTNPLHIFQIKLEFITEAGSSQGIAKVIESFAASRVTAFPVSTGSSFNRMIYRISVDRALPIPGIPRLRFYNTSGDLTLAHVALFKGDLTGTLPSDDQNTSLDFDELAYSTSPDGGAIPRGVVIPFIGGSRCPPGFKQVIGSPADGPTTDPISTVDYVFPTGWAKSIGTGGLFRGYTYDPGTDITTLTFENLGWPGLSQDGYSYYPWSSFMVRMPVRMRPPPSPPVYRFQVKIDRVHQTIFRARLPSPPPRPQRYEFVEVGLLKPAVVPGEILQVIPRSEIGAFFPKTKPNNPESCYNMVIGAVRTLPEYEAFEDNWDTKPYPESYNELFSEFDFNALTPSPWGIMTLIRLIQNLIDNIKRVLVYDPRRLGEPLPGVSAKPTGSGKIITEIDVLGDWRQAWSTLNMSELTAPTKGRIIRAGYVKSSPEEAGQANNGAQEHNHRVRKSTGTTISGVAVNIVNSTLGIHRPPVAVNHGHGFLGAGGYSRPLGRTVIMCVKE